MFFRHRSALWLMLLLVVLALGALAVAATRPVDQESKVVQAPNRPTAPAAAFLPITLKQGGFVPHEITRPAGNYYISVNDLSGAPELHLRLDRESGGRLHEVNVARQKRSWRKHIHLTPGTYLLTEASHPDWVCRITITPQ